MICRHHRPGARHAGSALRNLCTVALLCAAARLRAQEPAKSPYSSVVHARPSDAATEDAAADASVVSDDRTPRSGESVPQLLSELPGVSVNRTGGIGSLAVISLRGSTWDQVGVYVDGIPLNAAQGGGVDLSTLPLGDIERIEVYRGSSPIAFGTSALGGIISITTRAPRETRVDAELGTGSFDTWSAGASGSWVSRVVRVYVGAHYLSTAGDFWFTQDNGTAFDTSHDHEVRRQNDAVQQADGTARAVFDISRRRQLTAEALVYYRDQGLAGYGSVHQTTETSLASLRLIGSAAYESRGDLGDGSRLRAQLYYMREEQRYRDPLGEISLTAEDTRDLTTTVGFNLHLSRPVVSWLRLAAVAEGRDQLFRPYDADEKPSQGAPATRLFGGAGVEADALWTRVGLHVVPSLRVEVDRDVRSGRNSGTLLFANDAPPIVNVQPVARLAVAEKLPAGFTLRANAGHYGRMPSLLELYGDSGFVEGNPKLAPETGWNSDAGVEWRIARPLIEARVDVAGFASLVSDLIQFQQYAYGRAHAVNLGKARILGVETSIDVRVGRWARLIANFTYDDGRDVSDTSLGRHQRQLPNRPRVHFYGRPEGRWPLRRDVTLGAYVDLDATDGNYLDPANLVELPARFIFGAGLFAEATRAHLLVIASAQNLGDARTFDFSGFPLPSRSFFVSARLSLPKETP